MGIYAIIQCRHLLFCHSLNFPKFRLLRPSRLLWPRSLGRRYKQYYSYCSVVSLRAIFLTSDGSGVARKSHQPAHIASSQQLFRVKLSFITTTMIIFQSEINNIAQQQCRRLCFLRTDNSTSVLCMGLVI